MKIRDFGTAIAFGAAAALGSMLAKKIVGVATDPYERAVIKQKSSKIKQIINEK